MRSFAVELLLQLLRHFTTSHCYKGIQPGNGKPWSETGHHLNQEKMSPFSKEPALMDFVEELRFSSCNSKGGKLQPLGNFGAASGVG